MRKSTKDVLHMIVCDHDQLRESIDILTSDEATLAEKQSHLEKFLYNLRLHARTEESSFYDSIVSLSSLRPHILEAYEEHQIAENLATELDVVRSNSPWSDEIEAKSRVLAELVKHHADEEENVVFPIVRSELTKDELENLGVVYLQKRKDIKDELDDLPFAPSIGLALRASRGRWKDTVQRVSSYVSNRINPPR